MIADPYAFWRRAFLDAHDAATTIAMRGFAIQRAVINGDPTGGPEARSMVAEKVFAMQQGCIAAAFATTENLMRPVLSVDDARRAATRVQDAAAAPALRAVRANAKRLTGRR